MNKYKENKVWAIQGVSKEARDKVKKLCKEEKKTTGHWIDELILNGKNPVGNMHIAIINTQLKNLENSMEYLKLELDELMVTITDSIQEKSLKKRIFNRFFR